MTITVKPPFVRNMPVDELSGAGATGVSQEPM